MWLQCVGGGVDLLLRFARASRANLVLHAWRHGIGGIGPTARVGFVAGEFWWLPSFAGGVCQGRLEFVSCLDGHLPSLSLTLSHRAPHTPTSTLSFSFVPPWVSRKTVSPEVKGAILADVIRGPRACIGGDLTWLFGLWCNSSFAVQLS